jgi:large subunit ribosomal protein L29
MKWVVKQMKAKDLRDLSSTEIERKIAGYKEELFNLRFQHATGQLENKMRIRDVRRDIARAKTILRERELGIGVNA